VIEVFALEKDPQVANFFSKPCGFRNDGRPTGVGSVKLIELANESRVGFGLPINIVQLVEGLNEWLRHEATTIGPKIWTS
jgi:hypothetical protein